MAPYISPVLVPRSPEIHNFKTHYLHLKCEHIPSDVGAQAQWCVKGVKKSFFKSITRELQPTIHRHEGQYIWAEFSVLGEFILENTKGYPKRFTILTVRL